jgi:hypothetical protein
MDRRRFLLTSLAGALAAPLAGEAQPAPKVARIGVLYAGSTPTDPYNLYITAFKEALRRLGWVEGQNLVVEVSVRALSRAWHSPAAISPDSPSASARR